MVRSWSLAAIVTLSAIAGTTNATEEKPATGNAKAATARPHLEFRIVATEEDDGPAVKAARAYFDTARTDAARRAALKQRAADGLPPEPLKEDRGPGYSWVEIGPSQLRLYRLDDALEKATDNEPWKAAAAARNKGEPLVLPRASKSHVIWSRPYSAEKARTGKAAEKRFEYFLLTRDPEPGKEVTGRHFAEVKPGLTLDEEYCVNFKLNKEGEELMFNLTSRNTNRPLAVIVDGVVLSAPVIGGPIRTYGRIQASFSREQVDHLVTELRADIAQPTK